MCKVLGREYNSIAAAKARMCDIKKEIKLRIDELQALQAAVNNMNECNYQNNTVNQPDVY